MQGSSLALEAWFLNQLGTIMYLGPYQKPTELNEKTPIVFSGL